MSDGNDSTLKHRITLSTSGVVPEIARWRRDGCHAGYFSHAVRDDLRNELVPKQKYPIEKLLDACRAYPGLSNARRII